MKLIKKISITGKLTLKTGLHIGGSNSSLNIGGPDKFVVRNPINNMPYIPGSSLKGKMRTLIELRDESYDRKKGDPSNDPTSYAGALFGTAGDKNDGHSSRLIVRDAPMNTSNKEQFEHTDMPFTESKTEVSINRITGTAKNGGLRTLERVPAGAIFDVNMVLNIYDNENEEILLETLKAAMALLEDDYLGGNGSRGYGQVEFSDMKFESKPTDSYA